MKKPAKKVSGRGGGSQSQAVPARRILVAVDFSEPSRKALAAAVVMAQRWGAGLTVVHGVGPRGRPGSHGAFEMLGMTADPRRPAREKLAEWVGGEVPVEVETVRVVETGLAHKVVVEAAADWRADLIVIATHGSTGPRHWFLGSTAERVVRHAPCPVLVVRGWAGRGVQAGGAWAEPRNILLTTDFSDSSLAAFGPAASWAKEFGAKLTLLHVVPERLPIELAYLNIEFSEKEAAATARDRLPRLARRHLGARCAVETRVVVGSPEHVICEWARKTPAELVVMASHGYSGFKRLLVGSVTERVVQFAPCAVLVVPAAR